MKLDEFMKAIDEDKSESVEEFLKNFSIHQ